MSRKKIVAGNWKMNTSYSEALELVKQVTLAQTASDVTKIFFPPFTFLKAVCDEASQKQGFFTGAQNCSEHEKGAYTGEVAAGMISSVGCKYVLVGHSERRTFFKESDEQLTLKIEQALKNNLIPVFCFGEQLTERKNNTHFETVNVQLKEVLKHFTKDQVGGFILAYEPVWAIGTGETASPEQAQEMHAYVRKCLSGQFDDSLSQEISILYGGSCNAQNAADLFACKDVDGGLIGGASLKAADFCKIINSF